VNCVGPRLQCLSLRGCRKLPSRAMRDLFLHQRVMPSTHQWCPTGFIPAIEGDFALHLDHLAVHDVDIDPRFSATSATEVGTMLLLSRVSKLSWVSGQLGRSVPHTVRSIAIIMSHAQQLTSIDLSSFIHMSDDVAFELVRNTGPLLTSLMLSGDRGEVTSLAFLRESSCHLPLLNRVVVQFEVFLPSEDNLFVVKMRKWKRLEFCVYREDWPFDPIVLE